MIKSNMYSPQEIKLAQEIAKALDDETSISYYLACTKKRSHRTLRKTLAHVLAIPKAEIWKSRGALFTHLISQMDLPSTDDGDELEDNNDYHESIFG